MLPRWPTNPFGIVPQFPQFSYQVLIFINLLFLLQFHPSIPWYSNTNNLANCLLLSTTIRSGLLCASRRSVCIIKYQRILTFSDFRNFQGHAHTTCQRRPIRTFCTGTNGQLLQRHHVYLYIPSKPTLSIHKLCGLLILPYSCATCILTWQPVCQSFPFIALVRNAWSWVAVNNPSVFFLNSPFFKHVQERLLVAVCLKNWSCNGFSFPSCTFSSFLYCLYCHFHI